MRRKRVAISVYAGICILLTAIVLVVAFSYTSKNKKDVSHKPNAHILMEDKTYHLKNSGSYYTRKCVAGCEVVFETKASLEEMLTVANINEKIILDEDIELDEELYLQSFANSTELDHSLNIQINLDLNGHTLLVDDDDKTYDSVFMFNANIGRVNLNITNGTIKTNTLSYIFRFKNNNMVGENIKVNLDNVECVTSGVQTTPVFGQGCYNISFTAKDCRFISQCTTTNTEDYGVGAFIDSESKFYFNNCYFEGGDAIHVRSGNVRLNKCKLANVGLAEHHVQAADKFLAAGACLAVDNRSTADGISKYSISIIDCVMEGNASSKMIYVFETLGKDGLKLGVNSESAVNVQSCVFNNNPLLPTTPQYTLVKYQTRPQLVNNGIPMWVCGNLEL